MALPSLAQVENPLEMGKIVEPWYKVSALLLLLTIERVYSFQQCSTLKLSIVFCLYFGILGYLAT